MIFVTVGTHNQGFYRLVKKADEIADSMGEEIIIQRGHTAYEPRYASFFDFDSRNEMRALIEKARMIVSHGGAGSIIFALSAGKPVIVVPRLKTYKEHVNEHQLELARALEEEGKVKAVYDIEELEATLKVVENARLIKREKPVMLKIIKDYLREMEK